MEHVNHPKHYNARPDGLECIDIIRHYACDIANAIKYLWRAGLKPEKGKEDADKEVEDLEKALWYVNDQTYLGVDLDEFARMEREETSVIDEMLTGKTGHSLNEIANDDYYDKHVARAMFYLLQVGLLSDGYIYRHRYAAQFLICATEEIKNRINELKRKD